MDLSTTYMGMKLRSPLVPSASPLCKDLGNLRRMEDAGAGAIVLHSLFEEQLTAETRELNYHLEAHKDSWAEALSYFPEREVYQLGPDEYLEHIRKAKQAVQIPIIASLNGTSVGGWTSFARQMEQAGADALELNVYYVPTNMDLTSQQVEQTYLDILWMVKPQVKIPVAMKLSPFFSSFANMARSLAREGAQALVLFNRFYQPDINLETLDVGPSILLSTPQAQRLPMRWIAILHGRVETDLAATSGIHSGQDALKMIMAGASITQMCSALLKHGIDHLKKMETEMRQWMEQHEYESVRQMLGSMSQKKCPHPSAFERAQYITGLSTFALT